MRVLVRVGWDDRFGQPVVCDRSRHGYSRVVVNDSEVNGLMEERVRLDDRVRCARCGHLRDDDDQLAALAWVSEHHGTDVSWLCPRCARTHTRDIEAKLPHEWW